MQGHKLFAWRVGLAGLTKIIANFRAVVLLPILTKNIPIEEYGMWAQAMVTIGIIPHLMSMGLPSSMDRFFPSVKSKDKLQCLFYSFFSVSVLSSSVAAIMIFYFSSFFGDLLFGGNSFVVKILSLVIIIETTSIVMLSYFRATQQIKIYSSLLSLKEILIILTVSFFLFSGGGIAEALLALLIASVIIFVSTFVLIISQIGLSVPDFKSIKSYLNYGLPIIPSIMSSWVVNSSDRYIIGGILGTAAVGYYSPSYTLGILIRSIVEPLEMMLPMTLSKHYDNNNFSNVNKYLSYSLKYFLAIGIPSVFGLSLLSKQILTLLSTAQIAANGYLITPFVALGALILGIMTVYQKILLLVKQTKIIGFIWILAATINVILNIILIPSMGIVAAAVTTLVSFTVALFLMAYYSMKYFKFDFDFVFVFKSIFSSTIMSGIILLCQPESLINIFCVIILCALIYFTLLFLLKGFNKDELLLFKTIFSAHR